MDIKQIYQTDAGKILKKHLEMTIDAMDRVTNINPNLSKDEIAIQTLADIQTIKKLKEILELTEPSKPSKIEIMEFGKKYGL